MPVGTRSIAVELRSVRVDGANNDGYADDLSLSILVPEPSELQLGVAALATLAALRHRGRSTARHAAATAARSPASGSGAFT